MIQQSELNDLLKKKVMEQLNTIMYSWCSVIIDRYDPVLSKQYSSSNQKPTSTKPSHNNSIALPEKQPEFSLSDLIQPIDITADVYLSIT